LAGSLDASLATYGAQVQASRQATIRYWWRPYIDLYDFADHIEANISDATIRANAQAVKSAVGEYVLAERHSTHQSGSHGVSIFFPSDSSSFYNPARYDFAVGATWTGRPSPLDRNSPWMRKTGGRCSPTTSRPSLAGRT